MLRTRIASRLLMRRYVLALLLALPLVAGCTNSYYYVPAEQATATILGSAAARYVIPTDTHLGDVRIASFGVDDIQLTADTDSVPALHTRLIIANERGQQDWTVDTRNIQVQFSARTQPIAPALVHTNGTGMPIVTIPRGESRTIDTYHVLPDNLEDAGDVPQFDLIWQVQTDATMVSERTPFDRREATPPPPSGMMYGGFGMGAYPYAPWGPWYDPWLARPIIIQRITPAPRVYYYPHR